MELFLDFVKMLLPAAGILYAMYLVVRSFLNKDMEKRLLAVQAKSKDTTLPLRLQAYERLCLFLERITPNNLLLRLNDPGYSASEFQQVLVQHIREELGHNLSQQIYVSDDCWSLTKNAAEETIALINQAAQGTDDEMKSIDLAKRVFEMVMNNQVEPTTHALNFLKQEIRQFF